jgi:hypothetical protein
MHDPRGHRKPLSTQTGFSTDDHLDMTWEGEHHDARTCTTDQGSERDVRHHGWCDANGVGPQRAELAVTDDS